MDNDDSYLDLGQYVRVLRYATTPSTEEFVQVSKVAALGIALIGAIGYVIFLLMSFLPG